MKRQQGFTLLEAVVALTILASSSVALYSWLGTAMISLQKSTEAYEVTEVLRDFEGHLYDTVLTGETAGRVYSVNGYDIRWRATLIEPKQQGRAQSGALGRYIVGLYRIEGDVWKSDQIISSFQTRQVGYESWLDDT